MPKTEDCELLELAAKAFWAGDEVSVRYSEEDGGLVYICADNQDHDGLDCELVWNPLTDDGDRYRLIQALGLAVDFSECTVWKRLSDGSLVQFCWGEIPDYPQEVVDDEAHAVVRAAAEIGRAM